jgi:hypothetical protein
MGGVGYLKEASGSMKGISTVGPISRVVTDPERRQPADQQPLALLATERCPVSPLPVSPLERFARPT